MGFWDQMKRSSAAGLARYDEEVLVDGQAMRAVVDGARLEEVVSAGGIRRVVGFDLLVGMADGASIQDGSAVVARGMEGVVTMRVNEGSQWRVMVGPVNRWGGDIPGA